MPRTRRRKHNNIRTAQLLGIRPERHPRIRTPCGKRVHHVMSKTIQILLIPRPSVQTHLLHMRKLGNSMRCIRTNLTGRTDDRHFCHKQTLAKSRWDTFSVESAHPASLTYPFSAPQPCGRHAFTVGLLPSGPEPVPATRGKHIPPDMSALAADLTGRGINVRICRVSWTATAVLKLRPLRIGYFR